MVRMSLSPASSLTRTRLLSHNLKPILLLPLPISTFSPHHRFTSTNSTKSTPKVKPRQPHLSFPAFVSRQCKSGFTKLQDALNLFDQMLCHKPTLDIIVYTQLLGAVAEMGHFSTVISLYTRMMDTVDVEPDIYTFSILINCLGMLNQTRLGSSVLGVIFRHGYTPNHITFGAFVKGYCIDGKIDKAMVLFRRCEKFGTKFDIISHGAIIDGLCKNGKLDMAVEMLREMETKKGISPDIVIYSSLIYGMCHEKQWEEAKGYFKEMLDRGISPNLTTYNILINALCKDDKLEEARKMMAVMISSGIEPDVITFNSLIHGCCLTHEKKLEEAREMMAVMISRGIEPDVITFNSLIHGCCLIGRMEDAVEMFNMMVSKDCEPNLVTFNTLIDGFCKIKNPDEGARLFSFLWIHGESKDVLAKDSLLDELRKNLLGVPMQLLREVENRKLRPDIVTYNTLIAGMLKHGKVNSAKEMFNGISTKGLKPNLITYNTMIDGYCKEGMMEEAEELFLQMEVKGCCIKDCI